MFKKVLPVVCAGFLLVGCSSGATKVESMNCTRSTDIAEGVKLEEQLKFEYSGKTVTKQYQYSTIQTDTKEVYDQLVQSVEELIETQGYNSIEGVSHELEKDEENLKLTEKMTIDFDKISGDDYKKVTNGQVDTSGEKALIDVELTKESLEESGYACEAE